jgi:hypothetical protein
VVRGVFSNRKGGQYRLQPFEAQPIGLFECFYLIHGQPADHLVPVPKNALDLLEVPTCLS